MVHAQPLLDCPDPVPPGGTTSRIVGVTRPPEPSPGAAAVRVGQADDPAPARFVEILDRYAVRERETVKVGDGAGAKADCDETRLARLGDVNERTPVAAPAIEATAMLEAGQAEVFEEGPHCGQIGRGEADMGDVFHLDQCHEPLPIRF